MWGGFWGQIFNPHITFATVEMRFGSRVKPVAHKLMMLMIMIVAAMRVVKSNLNKTNTKKTNRICG